MIRCADFARCSLAMVLLVTASAAVIADGAPRQYYGAYAKHPRYNYYYRPYYYRPTPTYSGYKHHYVIHVPSKPKYVYYYNPYKKVYWGRCPVNCEGKPQYSLLAEKDRKGNLDEIPESAFPAPGALPPIPDSTDGTTLQLPPDDLPNDELPPTK